MDLEGGGVYVAIQAVLTLYCPGYVVPVLGSWSFSERSERACVGLTTGWSIWETVWCIRWILDAACDAEITGPRRYLKLVGSPFIYFFDIPIG